MNVRVAVVGCGRVGKKRADAARECGADVVAVVDADEERANALGSEVGGQPYASAEEVPWKDIDAAFICTPPIVRLEAVWPATTYATPVLVEKPLGLDAPSAWALVALAQQSQMVTAVGYTNRHRATIAMLRDLVPAGSLIGISCNWSSKQYALPSSGDRERSGGPINEQATHVIDLFRYIGGEVSDVVALGSKEENRLGAALLFDSGAVGTILYTCEAVEENIWLEITTTAGHVRLSGWDYLADANAIDGTLPSDDRSPFLLETGTFLESARRREANGIRCTFEDAYKTQLVVDAIREVVAAR